jgi:hypothetical protein
MCEVRQRRVCGKLSSACVIARRAPSALATLSGNGSRTRNRVVRSTSVPIAERLSAPMIRSPSQ